MVKDSDNTFANSFFSSYLENFFYEELRNMYCAEDFAFKRLPVIQVAANSPRLRMAIEEQVRIKSIHLSKLDEVFEILGINQGDKNIFGIKSILEEAEIIDQKTKSGTAARDIAIILSIQKFYIME
jgi:ferritin-like metal-binding protein YciE